LENKEIYVFRAQPKVTASNIDKGKGFSLFELIVYILLVSIVFSVSMRRFGEFPGEAERANFLAISMQLKAAVNIQMMNAIARGDWSELGRLENTNPMDLMLETPSNYAGSFNLVDEQSMPRRTWYFDSFNGQLVYLANDTSNLYSSQGDGSSTLSSIRFRIAQRYAGDGPVSDSGLGIDAGTVTGLNDPSLRSSGGGEGGGGGRKWHGLVLEEVTPFHWERAAMSLPGVEVPE
jgi:type II secretory pathway pseudopilin PulG